MCREDLVEGVQDVEDWGKEAHDWGEEQVLEGVGWLRRRVWLLCGLLGGVGRGCGWPGRMLGWRVVEW